MCAPSRQVAGFPCVAFTDQGPPILRALRARVTAPHKLFPRTTSEAAAGCRHCIPAPRREASSGANLCRKRSEIASLALAEGLE